MQLFSQHPPDLLLPFVPSDLLQLLHQLSDLGPQALNLHVLFLRLILVASSLLLRCFETRLEEVDIIGEGGD